MNSRRATLEIIAPTVNEAIEKGLSELQLPRDAVDIEILDEGSRGLFGLGAHQARVRLIVKQDISEEIEDASPLPESEISFSDLSEEEVEVKPVRIPAANTKEE